VSGRSLRRDAKLSPRMSSPSDLGPGLLRGGRVDHSAVRLRSKSHDTAGTCDLKWRP
jgi:hypothetical protein